MVLYKVTWQIEKAKINDTKIVDNLTKWTASAKDAGSCRKKARQMYGYISNSVQTSKIVVPTDKKGILLFLNSNIVKGEQHADSI
jgi:hypothetical protein